jgi:hypothetical protein
VLNAEFCLLESQLNKLFAAQAYNRARFYRGAASPAIRRCNMFERAVLSAFAVLIFIGFAPFSSAQSNTSPGGVHLPPLAEQSQGMGVPVKTEDQVNQERLQKYREVREQELRHDTDQLYQLTSELKDYMDKNSTNVLSLDMLKKAEKIEKLSHSVRTKMKDVQ